MARTYLQLVNSVLTRVKEDKVSSVSDTEDSMLVGEFVNEAMQWAEDCHEWVALRSTVRVGLATGEWEAGLTGSGNRSTILQVQNDTTDYEFGDAAPYKLMNKLLNSNDQEPGEPQYWDVNGYDTNGDPVISFFPKADQDYVINVNMTTPSGVLEDDVDELVIAYLPVVLYATALFVEDRGDEGGTSAQSLFNRAESALNRAITIDATTIRDEQELEFE